MAEIERDSNNDILDLARLGENPSPEYLKRVKVLTDVVSECTHVSQRFAGIPSPTGRHFYASVLFTALITRGMSLAMLAPHSPWSEKIVEHWDYSSAAGIARTMLEVRLAFHYLCVEPCSQEEWTCRWNILNLHDCVSRRRLFEALGKSEQVMGFEAQAEELRERLRSNSFFTALPGGQQKKLLNGQTAYLLPLEEIAAKADVDKQTFRWLYVLFSTHVHSLPMSFYRIGAGEEERGRGVPSPVEETYTSLCLSFAASLLVHTRDDILALFAEFDKARQSKTDVSIENKIENYLNSSEALSIGEKVVVTENDELRIEATLTGPDAIEVLYYHKPTNELVLRRSQSENTGGTLHAFDYAYWTFLVNGKAATERMIAAIDVSHMAFKVDADARTISFKVRK